MALNWSTLTSVPATPVASATPTTGSLKWTSSYVPSEHLDTEVAPPFIGGFAGDALSGLATLYGGGPQGIAETLKQDVQAGASDIQKGNVIKGVAKSALRTAGDVAGAVFAPISAGIEATGLNHVFDAVAKFVTDDTNRFNPLRPEAALLNTFTDQKAAQDFVRAHPNLEQDFGRASNLVLAAIEAGAIDPKTAIPRTTEQVKSATPAPTPARPAKPSPVADQIFNIENNYSKLRNANNYAKDDGVASRERIAQSNVLADSVNSEGTINTKGPNGAIEKYKAQTIDGQEGVVRANLAREGATININEVVKFLTDAISKSNLGPGALDTALTSGINKQVAGLMRSADVFGNIPLVKIHDAKINTTAHIDYTRPTQKTYQKAIASAYKQAVEAKSKTNVKEVNKELSKYYQDITRLENLDGRKVKGGKVGRYVAQIGGNIAGGIAGGAIGGPVGSALGTVVGGEVASAIKGKQMASTFGRDTGTRAPNNPVLEKAKADSKLPPKKNLRTPDPKVRAGQGITKTKEIISSEKKISDNVNAQKEAIRAKDYKLVYKLKKTYDALVKGLKAAIQREKDTKKEAK